MVTIGAVAVVGVAVGGLVPGEVVLGPPGQQTEAALPRPPLGHQALVRQPPPPPRPATPARPPRLGLGARRGGRRRLRAGVAGPGGRVVAVSARQPGVAAARVGAGLGVAVAHSRVLPLQGAGPVQQEVSKI